MTADSRISERLSALGFDLPRGRLALRTAVASGLALMLAWALGLAHPQWAAMTVWIAVQPTRSQLLRKSIYRVAGTVGGAVVGTLMLGAFGFQSMGLVVGLALWLALCAALGNVQRGFAGYGFILVGYSTALVALLGGVGTQPVVELGIDRTLTALLGVGVAILVTWWFTPSVDAAAVEARAFRATERICQSLRQMLGGMEVSAGCCDPLLAELAAVDSALDTQGSGIRQARALRALLAADTHVLLWMHGHGARSGEWHTLAAPATSPATSPARTPNAQPAQDLDWSRLAECTLALRTTCPDAASQRAVGELTLALRAFSTAAAPSSPDSPDLAVPPLVLHRDWLGGAQAGVRCLLLMLVIGTVWVTTGWPGGAYALMGAAVLSTLFSAHDDPSRTMRSSLVGHVLAVAAALACRWLVWPHLDSAAAQVVAIWPFLLVGAILMAHRRSVGAGLEFNMVTLLLLQPAFPSTVNVTASLTSSLGVLLGPLATVLAYRWIYPTNAVQRLDTLRAMMVFDLKRMVRARRVDSQTWRARLAHRTLRVAHWAGQFEGQRFSPTGTGVAVQAVADAVVRARALLERASDLTAHEKQCLAVFLQRMGVIDTDCGQTEQALLQLSRTLGDAHKADAQLFAETARCLSRNRAFLQPAAHAASQTTASTA